MNKAGEIDFSDITTFNLDEYYPIQRSNDQSYYYFMFDNLFSHVNIKKENVNVPNGEVSDPDAECRAYDEKIESYGGIDLQVLGIGHNGHIGFNEPDDKLIGATHRTGLTESTFHANSGYFEKPEDMPREALTMGLTPIMQAKKLNVPVAVIAGDIGDNIDPIYDMGVSFVLSTNRVAKSFSETKHRAKSDLALTFDTLARMIKTVEIQNKM